MQKHMYRNNKKNSFLLAGLFLLSFSTVNAQEKMTEEKKVTFEVKDRKLVDVVEFIRQQSGANIVVDEGIDETVSLALTDVSWRSALQLAAEKAGCVVVEVEDIIKVEKPPRVRFAFENADVTKVIDSIAKVSGANIVVGPEVKGTVSVRLNDVPFRDALDTVVRTLGYVVVEENRGILRVTDPVTLKTQLESRAFQLRFVRPTGPYTPKIENDFVDRLKTAKAAGKPGEITDFHLLKALEKALSPHGKLDYIERSNMVIVQDIPTVLTQMEQIINKIDVQPNQVFVDVKFVSTNNTDSFNFGVDYGSGGPSIFYSLSKIPIEYPFHLGDGGFEDGFIVHNGDNDGPFSVGGENLGETPGTVNVPDTQFGVLDFNQVAGTLRLLKSDQNAEVVQAPKIIAMDHQPATIFVGERVPYAEVRTEQGQAGGLSLQVAEAAKSPVSTGFQLLIIPHVVPNENRILMDVIPTQQTLTGTSAATTTSPAGFDVFTLGASGFEGTIALPRIASSTIATSMMLNSGHTAVIGGLSTFTQSKTVRGIPFLMDIPILGWLFRNENSSDDRRSLIVLITPSIIRTPEESDQLLEKELMERQERFRSRMKEIFVPEEIRAKMVDPMDETQEAQTNE